MSFGNALRDLGVVQEALIIGLMMVVVYTLFFTELDYTFRLGIAGLAFIIMFLSALASQILRQIKEEAKRA